MHRIVHIVILTFLVNFFCTAVSFAAWPWQDTGNLASINGVSYTPDDFKRWWQNWRDAENSFPNNPEQFIEWKLLAQEAKSMELDQEPNYQRKIDVFHKVRTRILLKRDAVDSQIELSEMEIKERYQTDYTPIYRMSLLYFDTEEKAENSFKGIADKEYTFDDLKEKAGPEGQPFLKEGRFRPINFRDNQKLRNRLEQFSMGQVATPQQGGNYFIILRLEEKNMPAENEFDLKRNQIREMMWKEKEVELTAELIKDLWKKYEVRVDEELMDMVDKDPGKELLARPVVITNRVNMPFWMVVKDVRKEYSVRKNKVWTEDEKEKMARGFLNGMIAEYLLTWEARDRRYEEKPPFKWTYEFYKENRLIKELEGRLIASQVSVSDAEVNAYYQENPDEFRPPEILSVILLKGEEKLITDVLVEVKQGQDFTQAGKKYNLNPIPVMNIPASQMSPEVVKAVMELDIDEVSQPFTMYNNFTLAKLVDRKVKEPLPLAKVKDKISVKLKNEKFSRARQEYIEMLLAESDITVNRKAWKKLQAEYTK